MKINHNISALNAYRNLSINTENSSKSLEKLSSGLRINRASDDAAGLAISEKMRSQIRGLDMAERNSLDGISLIQTAEGGLSSTHEILQRMRELAVQASNGSITDADRDEVQKEITQLTSEINRIGTDTEFNTAKLLDGSRTNTFVATGKAFRGGTNSINYEDGTKMVIADNSTIEKGQHTISIVKNTADPAAYNVSYDGKVSVTNYTTLPITYEGLTISGGGIKEGIYKFDIKEIGTGDDGSIHFQTGANAGQSVILEINDMSAEKIGISSALSGVQSVVLKDGETLSVWYTATKEVTNGKEAMQHSVDVSTVEKASAAITLFEDAIQRVSSERSRLGAVQNRLEYTIDNLSVMSENLTSAESRIRDLDMALEMTNFTKNNILNQAAQSMLAQANQMPQGVLQLLK